MDEAASTSQREESSSKRLLRLAPAFAALAVAFLAFLLLLPSRAIWINDEGNKLLSCLSLAERGELALPNPAGELSPSLSAYPPPFFVKGLDGAFRSGYSPFFPALCAPLAKFGGLYGARLLPLLCGLLCGLFAAFALAELGAGVRWRLCAFLLCSLGTPLLFYSFVFLEATLASALFAFSMLLFVKSLSKEDVDRLEASRLIALSGVFAALAAAFREEAYVCALAFAAALPFCSKGAWPRLLAAYAGGALPAFLPLWVWNYGESGSLLGLHAKLYAALYAPQTLSERFFAVPEKLWHFLFRAHFDSAFPLVLFVSLPFAGVALGLCGGRLFKAAGVALCLLAAVGGFLAQALSSEAMEGTLLNQSLCESFPFLALPFIFGKELWPDLRFRALLLSSVLASLGVASLLNMASVGVFWGARHFLLLAPQLCVLGAFAASRADGRLLKGLCVAVFVVCVLGQFDGLRLLWEKKAYSERILASMPPSPPLATDVFWLPEEFAAEAALRKTVFLEGDAGLKLLERACREKGMERFTLLLSPRFRALSGDAIRELSSRVEIKPGERFRKEGLSFLELQAFDCVLKP